MSFTKRLSRTSVAALLLFAIALGSVTFYLSYPSVPSGVGQVGEGRAALVDGLSELRPNPAFVETVRRYLMEVGMPVDIYTSTQVTVDFMKRFPSGYALIIFRVHSSTSRHGVFYFTGEAYEDSKYQPEQLRGELRPGKDYEGHPPVFAFGSKFVDTFLKNRFQEAIIVGMGCFGSGTTIGTEEEVTIENIQVEHSPKLADAFHRQGATAVIGWDLLVTLEFSERATLRLIRALAIERLTVSQATERVNLEIGAEPTYGSRLTFYPEENGDRTLLINSQKEVSRERMWLALSPTTARAHVATSTFQAGSKLCEDSPRP